MHLTRMMKSIGYRLLFLHLGLFLFISESNAEHIAFHFNPAQTQIHWKLRENFHTVRGTLTLNGGLLALNTATGDAQGEILVDIGTLQSGNSKRDASIKQEVLDADKYPQAFFHPTHVSGALKEGAGQQLNLSGAFNIHGADHPLTVTAWIDKSGNQANVKARFKLPYVDWGMKRPSGFLWKADKEVEIEIVSHASVEVVP